MRRAATQKAGSLQEIMLITKTRAEAAAQVSLKAAYEECGRANFDPFQYLGELPDFVSQTVRAAEFLFPSISNTLTEHYRRLKRWYRVHLSRMRFGRFLFTTALLEYAQCTKRPRPFGQEVPVLKPPRISNLELDGCGFLSSKLLSNSSILW